MGKTTSSRLAEIKDKKYKEANKVKIKLETLRKQTAELEVIKIKESLRGDPGKDGVDGKDGREIELRKGDTHIQWKYVGDDAWADLIAISDLKGEKGDKPKLGIDYVVVHGKNGRDGKSIVGVESGSDSSESILEDSTFTYNNGLVTRIDYISGQYKTFIYNPDNTVSQIVWTRLKDTVTKNFTYNLDGTLSSVDVTIV
jgi:hypothetical protein